MGQIWGFLRSIFGTFWLTNIAPNLTSLTPFQFVCIVKEKRYNILIFSWQGVNGAAGRPGFPGPQGHSGAQGDMGTPGMKGEDVSSEGKLSDLSSHLSLFNIDQKFDMAEARFGIIVQIWCFLKYAISKIFKYNIFNFSIQQDLYDWINFFYCMDLIINY